MFTELQHIEPARRNHPQMSDIFTFVVFSGHLSYCQYINFNTDVQNASIKVKQQRFRKKILVTAMLRRVRQSKEFYTD